MAAERGVGGSGGSGARGKRKRGLSLPFQPLGGAQPFFREGTGGGRGQIPAGGRMCVSECASVQVCGCMCVHVCVRAQVGVRMPV